jgi:hypothetical protein
MSNVAIDRLQQQTAQLCRDLVGPLRMAATRGQLLAASRILDGAVRGGIHVAVPAWVPAGPGNSHVRTVLERLDGVADNASGHPRHVAQSSFPSANIDRNTKQVVRTKARQAGRNRHR